MRLRFLLLAGLAASAAASAQAQSNWRDAAPYIAKLKSEGERNRVLNQLEIGTRSFWAGQPDDAARALDDAIVNIELVYKNDAGATKARSLWHEEGAKNFKGEPYERAMAYYYRGLVYLRNADYENARAAFRQGLMQDAFAEEEQNQADFALLMFLEAWASHLNGDEDLRDETIARLKKLRPEFPGIGAKDDTLLLVETGTAPRKLGDGANHSYFVYRRGKGFKENRAAVVAGGAPVPLFPMEDIYYQATTRGGRVIDKILEGKVEFVRTTGGIGSAFAEGSVMISQMGGGAGFAGAVGAVGALSALISANAKPRADTRQWSSLPDTVHVGTFSSAKLDPAAAKVTYFTGEAPGGQEDQPVTVHVDSRGNRLALLRSR